MLAQLKAKPCPHLWPRGPGSISKSIGFSHTSASAATVIVSYLNTLADSL